MNKNNIFENLEDAVEYLYSEEIEGDVLALPPEEDELTDEEGFDDEETGIPAITDVSSYVKIQPKDPEDDCEEDNLPSTTFVSEGAELTSAMDTSEKFSQIQHKSEWIKYKVKNVLMTSKFCGLCVEGGGNLTSVHIELMIGRQEYSKSLCDIINYVFNDDIENFMSSLLLCDSCLEKVIQSYLFIHNTKQLSKVINNCIIDLNSKVIDINAQVAHNASYSNANVMIVLENDTELYKNIVDLQSVEVVPAATPKVMKMEPEIKPEFNLIEQIEEASAKLLNSVNDEATIKYNTQAKETQVVINQVSRAKVPAITLKEGKLVIKPLSSSQNVAPRYNTYECADCTEIFTNYRLLKEHEKLKHKKVVFRCKFCDKCYNTQQYLNIHYKTHEIARCKLCKTEMQENQLMDHLRINHANHVYPCQICKLVYYTEDSLDTHFSISHLSRSAKSKSQCVMCLRNFTEQDLKTHRCKFSCSECFVMPCVHYKYLKSFREQVLNHVNKIECIDCDYHTRRKEHLIGHVNREHLDHHPFTCAHCGQQFYTKLSLKTHMVQFHQDLCCEYCDFQFKDPNTLESHRKACKQVIRRYGCSKCTASFDLEEEFQRHANLKHSEVGHACNLCKSKFLTQVELDEHRARVHGGIQCKKRRKHIECTLCNEFFKNLKVLSEHEKIHSPNDMFPCKLCTKTFDSLRKLYIHNQKHYTKRIKCPSCDKNVATSFYTQHSARCSYKRNLSTRHVCETCGKFFKYENLLLLHQKSHLAPEPCPICDKNLKPNSLKKHIEIAHGEFGEKVRNNSLKPTISCEVCGHFVRKKADLETHMNRFHLKIKPYVCNVCKKSFCGKLRLKEHLATHSSDNTCFCSECGKKFANRVCLKMHFRKHTGESPYTCDICGQKFRSSSMMKTHRLKKHLAKTVGCPLCDNMFYMARDMRHHFKKAHWKFKDRPFDHREVDELDPAYYHLFEDGRLPNLN